MTNDEGAEDESELNGEQMGMLERFLCCHHR